MTSSNSLKVELISNNCLSSWLIDTGASISAVKYDYVLKHGSRIIEERSSINGIGGKVEAIGYVWLRLQANEESFTQKFYVFNSLPCTAVGILGHDFLSKYQAILDYRMDNLVLITNNNQEIHLKILKNLEDSYFIIPPRSESIHYIDMNVDEESVVCAKEMREGIFMASTIVKPILGKIPVLILNTTENEVKLKNITPTLCSLNEYNVCSFGKGSVNADRVKKLFKTLNLNYLNKEEKVSIENLTAKYSDIFYLPNDKLTVTKLYKQCIHLKQNANPVFVKPYRLPHSQKQEIEKQINKMLSDGVIEPTKSEWSSPVLLVPKKVDSSGQKKWRLVIDYRKLNDRIQDDKFPLPNITEILDSLSGSIYFSHLDLYSGYYQQELEEDSRKYTAFCSGQYQMTRLPMGLKTSPSSFSRMITLAMSGLTYDKCFVYLDDIIVFGKNLDDHNRNLQVVFSRLREVNLKLNPLKCEFLKKEILYLGHLVTSEGILPDPDKVKAVKEYPIPKNAEDVKRFVALVNYYRKFINNFAEKAHSLNNLSRKNVKFDWDHNCQKSFQVLKESIISPPVLQYPNFEPDNEFIIQTDASGYAIGAVLSNADGRPVAYASRSLNSAEEKYATIEKELLAIVWATKHFRPYLFGRHFQIKTDHRPLIYLFNMKDPSSRLLKFRLALEEYDYTVEYVRGTDNAAADALSRIKITSSQLKEMNECIHVMTRSMRKNENQRKQNSTDSLDDMGPAHKWSDQPRVVDTHTTPRESVELLSINGLELNKLRKVNKVEYESNSMVYVPIKMSIYIKPFSPLQMTPDAFVRELGELCRDCNIQEIYFIKNKNNKVFIDKLAQEINNDKKWTSPRLNILQDVEKIYEKDDRKVILNDFHLLPTSGHAGIRRMYNNIKKYYFWPGLERDVTDFVKKCEKCQKEKYSKYTKEPMIITSTAHTAFQKIYLDLVGPLERDMHNYSYILSLQCELTKYVEAYPLVSKSATEVAQCFVNNFILRYGVPAEIATDRGTEFMSTVFKEVCTLLKINQLTSTAYHHQTIGALENSHKSLGAYLRIQTDNHPEEWSKWLPFWSFSYNTSVHTETKFSPYELVFGKKCTLPSNLSKIVEPIYNHDSYPCELKYRLQMSQKEARKNLLDSKMNRKERYDKHINPITYKPNDLILVKNETGNKLQSIYLGPYTVVRDLSPNVEIVNNGKIKLIHKNRTKLFIQ